MFVPQAGFRSREEMQREQALTGRYRQIGIRAVASATHAARPAALRQFGEPDSQRRQFGETDVQARQTGANVGSHQQR